MEYRVIWSIDVDAEDTKKAAEEALKIMRDPGNIATFFDVMPGDVEGIGWLEGILDEYTMQVNLEE